MSEEQKRLFDVVEQLRMCVYAGHQIKDELAREGIPMSPIGEALLDGKMEGYHEAIQLILGKRDEEPEWPYASVQ